MSNTILFFDGVCGLCNRSVNFLIRFDKKNNLKFAPLQGKTAEKLLKYKDNIQLDSMVLIKNNIIYKNSTAIIYSILELKGLWNVFGVLFIIPPFIRDWIYLKVAKNRYQIFGKMDVCRIPSESEKNKFLD